MFFIYLKVLVLGQCHLSCFFFADLLSKFWPVVGYDGLDARLVMHVDDEFFTGFGNRLLRPGLKSLLASVISLHTKAMYPFIISRKVQWMRRIEQCCARETYPKLCLHPRRLVGVLRIEGDGVVVKRVGRLRLRCVRDNAEKVLLAQKT